MSNANTPEWVYFVMHGSTATLRRYDAKKAGDRNTQTEYKAQCGQWDKSIMTIFGAEAYIKQGKATLANEFGSALEEAPEVSLALQLHKEVTDPKTGFTYKLDASGAVLTKAPNSSSFYAAPCNAHTIRAVISLGLVEVPS